MTFKTLFKSLGILFGIAAHAGSTHEVVVEHNVEMTTRDGVILRADVYRPEASGRFPVLLKRTPYNKYIYVAGSDFDLSPVPTAARGYVVIIQDARGRFESEGEWYPFRDEVHDTYDTVEWAARLPYANGKVALMGISYVGVPQLLGATAAPPHLMAIFPGITGSNYHSNWIYQGGAFSLFFSRLWASEFAIDELTRKARKSMVIDPQRKSEPAAAERPWLDPGPATEVARYYDDWIAHPAYDCYWKQWSIEERYAQIKVPALHVAGWYDLFLGGSLRNYEGIKARGGSDSARKGQRLLIVPGGHAGNQQKIGEIDFGPDSVFDMREYGLRWLDWVMKGVDNGVAREKPVRIFVMGKNVWRDEDEWPLKRALTTRYFLRSQGKANSLTGDGSLSLKPPHREPPDRYVFDPDNPVPTYGGMMPGSKKIVAGPLDQRRVESRSDVLIYSTSEFKRDTEVTGPLSVDLYVSSSALDTDFTAKLVDVWPNGFAQNLAEGILRARYRSSMERAELMVPGKIYKLTIDLWATSNVFLTGHKMRLEITSSNYPRFDLNPNTGEEPGTATKRAAATNVIYHDRQHPSALVVPIVPTDRKVR